MSLTRRNFGLAIIALFVTTVPTGSEARGRKGSSGRGGGGCGSKGGAGFRKPNGKCADRNGK
jgi:hypothetical protein